MTIKKKVLIISDDSTAITAIKRIPEFAETRIETARTLVSVDEKLSQSEHKWIFLDLSFQQGAGVQLLDLIATKARQAILMLFADGDAVTLNSLQRLAEELGLTVAGTTQKPLETNHIVDLLDVFHTKHKPISMDAIQLAMSRNEFFSTTSPISTFQSTALQDARLWCAGPTPIWAN